MGRWIKSKAQYTGRNYDVGPWRDDKYVRCSRCGFINNLDQAMHAQEGGYEGWGTTFVPVASNSPGSGFGTNSPIDTMQTAAPSGQMMYSSSIAATDLLVNSYGSFSFIANGTILLNGTTTSVIGVMLLLFNSNMYYINNSSQWYQYIGSWVLLTTGDPRLQIGNLQTWDSETTWNSGNLYDCLEPYVETTMDAVVGGGCCQCGTYLYDK